MSRIHPFIPVLVFAITCSGLAAADDLSKKVSGAAKTVEKDASKDAKKASGDLTGVRKLFSASEYQSLQQTISKSYSQDVNNVNAQYQKAKAQADSLMTDAYQKMLTDLARSSYASDKADVDKLTKAWLALQSDADGAAALKRVISKAAARQLDDSVRSDLALITNKLFGQTAALPPPPQMDKYTLKEGAGPRCEALVLSDGAPGLYAFASSGSFPFQTIAISVEAELAIAVGAKLAIGFAWTPGQGSSVQLMWQPSGSLGAAVGADLSVQFSFTKTPIGSVAGPDIGIHGAVVYGGGVSGAVEWNLVSADKGKAPKGAPRYSVGAGGGFGGGVSFAAGYLGLF